MSFIPQYEGQRSIWLAIKSVFDALEQQSTVLDRIADTQDEIASRLTAVGAFGELAVIQRTPVAGWRFDYGVNTDLVSVVTANGGAVTQADSKALLEVDNQVNSVARVSTIRKLRYTPGRGGLLRCTCVFDPKAGIQQIIGIGDLSDGLFFGFNGTQFGIMRRYAGNDLWVYQADWNGDFLVFTPNYALGNVFQISYQWLGFGVINFYMENPDTGLMVNIHRVKYPNTAIVTSLLNPTLPVMIENRNNSGANTAIMQCPSAMAFIEGEISNAVNPLDIQRSLDQTITVNTAVEHHVITLRNKATFLAVANRIVVEINSINLSRASGSNLVTWRIRKNATFGAGLVYTDVSTNNSPCDFSITTTTVSAGDLLRSTSMANAQSLDMLFAELALVLQAGDTITISALLGNPVSTALFGSINFTEEF